MEKPDQQTPEETVGPVAHPEDGGLVRPDGRPATADEGVVTERGLERTREEQRFVPVIVKRSDQAKRHPDDILSSAIEDGLEQLERPAPSLVLSAVAAGLILAFTALAVAMMTVVTEAYTGTMLQRLAAAFVYPLGFVLCIMSGTELFTEHTATAVYPVLDRQARIRQMLRLWVLVGAGNLLGALAGSGLLVFAEDVVGARAGYLEIGRHLVEFDNLPLFASSMLAGWLMALGAWLIHATPPGISQIVSIYIVTFLIGLGGLHHSIAGSVEMLTAYFLSDQLTLGQSLRFIGMALVGNLAGGSFFVAVLNYGHIRRTQKAEEADE